MKVKSCIIILLSILCLSCIDDLFNPKKYYAYFKNNSTHSVDIYLALGYGINSTAYPDTTLPIEYGLNLDENIGLHPANSRSSFFGSIKKISTIFDELPQDTLSIFVFHSDTLKKYTWEEVCKDYKILKRYDLSYEDLKEMDFEVVYP